MASQIVHGTDDVRLWIQGLVSYIFCHLNWYRFCWSLINQRRTRPQKVNELNCWNSWMQVMIDFLILEFEVLHISWARSNIPSGVMVVWLLCYLESNMPFFEVRSLVLCSPKSFVRKMLLACILWKWSNFSWSWSLYFKSHFSMSFVYPSLPEQDFVFITLKHLSWHWFCCELHLVDISFNLELPEFGKSWTYWAQLHI